VRVIAATHRNLEEAIAQGSFREDLYYRLNVVPIDMPPLRERIEDLPLLIEALMERLAAGGQPAVQFSPAALTALRAYRWPGNVRELGNLLERMAVQYGGRIVGIAELPARYRPAQWEQSEAAEAATVPIMIASIAAPELLASAFNATLEDGADAETAPTATVSESESEGEPLPMDPALADALLAELPPGFDLRAYLESLERRLIERALESAGGTVAHAARLLGLRRTTLVEKLRKYALGSSEALAES
jgi:sigma-54 specific flagellar transcriptional regulator A